MNFRRRVLAFILLAGMVPTVLAAKRVKKTAEEPFLLVVGIVEGSIADQLGIKEGDILRAYNGNGVQSIEELEAAKALAGDSAEVLIERDGQTLSFIVPPGQIGVYLQQRLPELEYAEDAVVLTGIPPLKEEEGMNNSFILSLTYVSNYLKDTLDYTMLMGLSGAAFRLQRHYDWDMSAIQASEGYRCDLAALEALGYEYKYMELLENRRNQEEIREAIIQAIDAGSPVIAFQLGDFPDWGIITGYQKSAREFIVRTYDSKRTGYTLADNFPKKVCIIEGRNVPPTLRAAEIRSFAIAQEILETEDRIGDYYVGRRALKNWLQALETESFYDLNPEDFKRTVEANAWMFTQLAEDRAFAADYLKRIADDFPDIKDTLLAMATLYKSETEHLNLAFSEDSCIVWPDELDSQDEWTPQLRISEINYLRFALVKEDEALKIWRYVNSIYNPQEEEKEEEGASPSEESQPEEKAAEKSAPPPPEPPEIPKGAQ